MIPVFVGSDSNWGHVEPLMRASLLAHTDADVDITFMRPESVGMRRAGCTGFTMTRFAVPELCRERGYSHGIYIDVDMFLIADIAELWTYRRSNVAQLADGSNEVSIWPATLEMPSKAELHRFKKWDMKYPAANVIPLEWNCEDCDPAGAKLIHYTDLSRQPWDVEREDSCVSAYRNSLDLV